MDLVLEYADYYALDRVYDSVKQSLSVGSESNTVILNNILPRLNTILPQSWKMPVYRTILSIQDLSILDRDSMFRQGLSLFLITWLFGALLYITMATLSYYLIYDQSQMKHPLFLKNQIRKEISCAMVNLPFMALYTVPWFLAEIRGYSKLYMDVSKHGLPYLFLQFPLFIVFTDFGIYWIHRYEHHPLVYKNVHKLHHKWVVPTPFASHAFQGLDGYFQSLPYHIFPFIFPLHKIAYIVLFAAVNIWTVSIHDGEYIANNPFINGAAHHTEHHLYFKYNFGQFLTLWDRIGGSYRTPCAELFNATIKNSQEAFNRQTKEAISIAKEIDKDDTLMPEKANKAD